MSALNYKHLRYFWMVAKTGSIAKAASQLNLTPHSISGQLSEFADTLGVALFRKSGRSLELTDTGRRIVSYAETIFSTGDELLELVRDKSFATMSFRIGCADSVSKLIACQLVEPALKLKEPVRLICREGRLDGLIGDLAVHRLDLVIADRPIPGHFSVRAYNHLLGQSPMTALCTQAEVHPHIVGEFDDSAMMNAFGQSGAGVFFVPTVIAAQVSQQYQVVALGQIDGVVEQVYAITTERRMSHPATVAISTLARDKLFV